MKYLDEVFPTPFFVVFALSGMFVFALQGMFGRNSSSGVCYLACYVYVDCGLRHPERITQLWLVYYVSNPDLLAPALGMCSTHEPRTSGLLRALHNSSRYMLLYAALRPVLNLRVLRLLCIRRAGPTYDRRFRHGG